METLGNKIPPLAAVQPRHHCNREIARSVNNCVQFDIMLLQFDEYIVRHFTHLPAMPTKYYRYKTFPHSDQKLSLWLPFPYECFWTIECLNPKRSLIFLDCVVLAFCLMLLSWAGYLFGVFQTLHLPLQLLLIVIFWLR